VCLHRETGVWLEVTTLLIPGENDGGDEIERASDWFADNLGPDVPWHFTAFHPDFKMLRAAPTPSATLARARDIARSKGLKYVYTGNVHDRAGGSTWCPTCGALLIERQWHELGAYHMDHNRCDACGCAIAGRFESHPGSWGARRQAVRLA
jgi:pyruvate formate lyase activating enzyme